MSFRRAGKILFPGIRVAFRVLAQFLTFDCGAICILGGMGLGAILGFTLMQVLEPRPVLTADEFSLLEYHCGQGMDLRELADFMSAYYGAVAGLFGGGWLEICRSYSKPALKPPFNGEIQSQLKETSRLKAELKTRGFLPGPANSPLFQPGASGRG